MAGRSQSAGLYQLNPQGKQVYLHCMWKTLHTGRGRLTVHYIGCGQAGRAQQCNERKNETPGHAEWLARYWVPRTVLFAQPRRLESLDWLEEVLAEYGCAEGLVIFETPFLEKAERVEQRLIDIYRNRLACTFNRKRGKLPAKHFKAQPNLGKLRDHAEAIRRRHADGETKAALAREFGVDPTSIRDIVTGRSYPIPSPAVSEPN